jgi:hypothetical protein
MGAGGALHDLALLVAGVIPLDEEHEAVLLGLGQRIGAFLLDRVLGGELKKELLRGWSCRRR